jgi:hypothetical protein
MPSELEAFLARNSVVAADSMPLVHTTRSYNFRAIMKDSIIAPQDCDVFINEKLSYFFVGRPAYKYSNNNPTAESWELPCCFVFESDALPSVKRIFPFDSGAFSRGLYPDYIGKMPLGNFLSTEASSPSKLIGAFFGDTSSYFGMSPKPRSNFEQEYSLNPFDAELLAASRLASESSATKFDDRRFTIEVQTDQPISLSSKVMAVIIPEVYLSVDGVIEKIEGEWDAEVIGYPIYSLSTDMYYAIIYKEIHSLYKRKGLL